MRYSGRIFAISIIFFFHTAYLIYYFYRDGHVDIVDLLGYPLFFCIAYWAGLQFDKATFYSEKDMITNLYNRRFVINTYEKIMSLAERTNSKLFVLVIDCDNFKHINDFYGHHKGDLVLAMIGETLAGSMRKSDIVARWGGDEFLVIGHYKEESGLQTVLQRLDDDMKNLSKQINIPIQVSIGSAIYPDHNKNLFELIKSADQNMYECKEAKKRFVNSRI